VNRLLRRVRDYAQVHGDGTIDRATAQAALALFEVDADGLDRLDRSAEALVKSFGGGPAGLSTLQSLSGRSQKLLRVSSSRSLCARGS
jgi:Holliday junction DNA helicase RuvB